MHSPHPAFELDSVSAAVRSAGPALYADILFVALFPSGLHRALLVLGNAPLLFLLRRTTRRFPSVAALLSRGGVVVSAAARATQSVVSLAVALAICAPTVSSSTSRAAVGASLGVCIASLHLDRALRLLESNDPPVLRDACECAILTALLATESSLAPTVALRAATERCLSRSRLCLLSVGRTSAARHAGNLRALFSTVGCFASLVAGTNELREASEEGRSERARAAACVVCLSAFGVAADGVRLSIREVAPRAKRRARV
jgi:hypothetical protein